MRKRLLGGLAVALLAALCLSPTGAWAEGAQVVEINEANFPDQTFRESYVKTYDTDNDGWLSDNEIAAVTEIKCQNKQISSLKGIEHFTALTFLSCISNSLTSLDLSGNTALRELNCSLNSLGALDVSKNTELERLCCFSCGLTSLDVRSNDKLRELICYGNELGALDVRSNTALEKLNCSTNSLASLDVSQNGALKGLICAENNLTSLDVGSNAALERLYCYSNNLTSLDVTHNTALAMLLCSCNKLSTLDASCNTALAYLDCSGNSLTSLSLSPEAPLQFGVNCESNSYTIGIDANRQFDLSKLPSGFDINKASGWNGGNVTDGVLTVNDEATSVTYTYDCGNNKSATFTLRVEDAKAPVIAGIVDGKAYCSAQTVTVTDENLASVTVNGVAVALDDDGSFTLGPAAGEQKVIATDKAGNTTTVTVTVNDGHTWSGSWSHNAAEHWRECSVCGEKTDVAEHAGSAADCVTSAICYTCEDEYGEPDPNNHHRPLVHEEAKAATTEAEGNIEFWYCGACDRYFSDAAGTNEISYEDTVIPKLDPKKDEGDKKKEDGEKAEEKKKDDDGGKVEEKKQDDGRDADGEGKKAPAIPQTGDGLPSAAIPLTAGLAALALAALAKRRDA